MATKFSPKALALREELAAELKLRPTASALAQAKSFGTAGECDLAVGAGVAGGDNVFVRIKTVTTLQKDVLGLDQQVFTPHIAQVVLEAEEVGATAEAAVGTWATRLAVLGGLIQRGIAVELYLSANGTAPTSAGITGAPTAVYIGHPQYGQMASI